MKRVSVLNIIHSLNTGGAQSVLMSYIDNLKDDNDVNFQTAVITTSGDSIYDKRVEAFNLPVKYYNYKADHRFGCLSTLLNWIKYQKLVIQAIKDARPDVVHTHLTPILGYTILPCKLLKVRHIVNTLHSDPYAVSTKFVLLGRICFNLLDVKPVCVTETQASKAMQRYKISPPIVIHNGVDYSKYIINESKEEIRTSLDIPMEYTVIGTVGRLNKIKNFDFLLRVFSEYQKHRPQSILLFAGEGSEYNHLLGLCKELQIYDKVRFLGNRSDMPRIYKALDIFMLTSFFESSSIVTVEAQLSKVKCVISDRIPKDVIITDGVVQLSLDESIDNWVDAMLNMKDVIRVRPNYNSYSVLESVNKLKKIYQI